MRVVHFADTHIGVETYGRIDPVSGLSTRVIDELKALDEVVNFVLSSRIDLVLFCGDVYKNREPSQTHQREFAARIRLLSEAKVPTVIVVGNHDLPGSQYKANSVDIFETLNIDNIYIARVPEIKLIETASGPIQVAVLPWLRRNALLLHDQMKNLDIDEIIGKTREIITSELVSMAGRIDTSFPAVLAAHVAVSNAKLGTERNMMIGNDPEVMLSSIASPVYDYIALGHVHRQQVLSNEPPVVYAGSLERLDFSDEEEEKGFYVVDIFPGSPPRRAEYRFHRVNARRFLTIEVRIDNEDTDPTHIIVKTIEQRKDDLHDAIVRIRLNVPSSFSGKIRDNEIFKAAREAYNVSMAKEIRNEMGNQKQNWLRKDLTPLEALKNYLVWKNIPPDRQNKLIDYARKLIENKLASERE
jgi:exonuclease SbcD